ncbi:MAG: hypothetical protein WC211_00645 [Dehalococcoidia bacterium]
MTRTTQYRAHLPGCAPQVVSECAGHAPSADARRRCDALLARFPDVTRVDVWRSGRLVLSVERRAA